MKMWMRALGLLKYNISFRPGLRLLKFSCFSRVYMAQIVRTGCNSYEEELAHELP